MNSLIKSLMRHLAFSLCLASLNFLPASAAAQGLYTDLYDLGGNLPNGDADGNYPVAVVLDKTGDIFGTTDSGGTNGVGILWELTAGGQYKVLHNFGGTVQLTNGQTGKDGQAPLSNLAFDANGNLFGGTLEGGNGGGMIWELTTAEVYKDFHDFGGTIVYADGSTGPDGNHPTSIAFDSSGNLVGSLFGGGKYTGSGFGDGLIWKITVSGSYIDLHDFGGTVINANGQSGHDGSEPLGLCVDNSGDLFGATEADGPNGKANGLEGGIVWEITKSGAYRDLHDFGGMTTNRAGNTVSDGAVPVGVAVDASGDLFGVTYDGGESEGEQGDFFGSGIAWEITASGTYKDLQDFGLEPTNAANPDASPVIDNKGNIYGTATAGGSGGSGAVWELENMGSYYAYAELHDFGGTVTYSNGKQGPDGGGPSSVLALDGNRNVFGAANAGEYNDTSTGDYGGLVFAISFGTTLNSLTLSSASVVGGNRMTGTVNLGVPAPSGGVAVDLAVTSGNASVPSSVTVPAGARTASFAITTPAETSAASVTIQATQGNAAVAATFAVQPPSLQSLSLSQYSVVGGGSVTGTVSLNGPAPAGGETIGLGSSSSVATLSASSLTVAAGATSAAFSVSTSPVGSNTSATIAATLGSSSLHQTLSVTVAPPTLTAIQLSSGSVVGGSNTSLAAKVTLSKPAPSATVVALSSTRSGVAGVPASVTVPQGASTAVFPISDALVTASQKVGIAASLNGATQTAYLTVAPLTMTGFQLSTGSVVGGSTTAVVVKVTLSNPVGANTAVNLSSTNPDVVGVASTLVVPAGSSTALATLDCALVATTQKVGVVATFQGVALTPYLTVTPVTLTALKLSQASVQGSSSATVTAKITLNTSVSEPVAVALSSSNPAVASVPSTVTVARGAATATFAIAHSAVNANSTVALTATYNGVTQTVYLKVTP